MKVIEVTRLEILCVMRGITEKAQSSTSMSHNLGMCEKMSGNFLLDKSYIFGYVPQ